LAAAKQSEEAQRTMDDERRAAAKKRLQLAGAKVAQGMGRDTAPSTPEPLQQQQQQQQQQQEEEELQDGHVEDSLHESHCAQVEGGGALAEGGALSVAEVGSFVLEDGWLVACSSIRSEFSFASS
jgi:hypothetical protein